ncbi:uncharacterized protein [Littorina saxatilis]|uniref:uncharacterized protein isoform X2 n=1 Tax=Littorina saxatilis TaxID=31220 RepID=UPI0038B64E5E
MRFVLLVCIVHYCVGVAGNSSNGDFTCIAGNFTTGQRGNVTCHFGPDIHKIGYHFEIVKYPFGAHGSHSGDDVLRCHRLGSAVKCNVETGYDFDKHLHDNVTVFIPNVTTAVAGRYACQLIPPDNRKKKLCDLLVTGLVLAAIFGALLILCILYITFVLIRKLKKSPEFEDFVAKYIRRNNRNKTDRPSVDEEDARREPFIIRILPQDETTDEDTNYDTTVEIRQYQEPLWYRRLPFREPYNRAPYTASAEVPVESDGSPSNVEFTAPRLLIEDNQDNADNASPKTFAMPSIVPFDKMNDEDKTDQAPPQHSKLLETGLRRPKLMPHNV